MTLKLRDWPCATALEHRPDNLHATFSGLKKALPAKLETPLGLMPVDGEPSQLQPIRLKSVLLLVSPSRVLRA
jgi:hypothetical protein